MGMASGHKKTFKGKGEKGNGNGKGRNLKKKIRRWRFKRRK